MDFIPDTLSCLGMRDNIGFHNPVDISVIKKSIWGVGEACQSEITVSGIFDHCITLDQFFDSII